MKVIILRNVCVRGVAFGAGPDVVDLDKNDAETLIRMGKARPAQESPKETAGDIPAAIREKLDEKAKAKDRRTRSKQG